jgi:hypothetical protein
MSEKEMHENQTKMMSTIQRQYFQTVFVSVRFKVLEHDYEEYYLLGHNAMWTSRSGRFQRDVLHLFSESKSKTYKKPARGNQSN